MRNDLVRSVFSPLATLIRVTGDDAFSFLQGQFTNELRAAPGSVTYGLWLNQKGKVLADSHILRLAENEFLLVSATSPAATLLERLEAYIIADDVVLADETGVARGITLWGDGCGEILKGVAGEIPESGKFSHRDGAWIFAGRGVAGENYEIIGPDTILVGWQQLLLAQGSVDATAGEWELARISSGIPAIPQEIGPTDLPNEAGLEVTAISYTKGCYLGQEVMARLKNLGQVRRHLRRVHGAGAVPGKGALLFQAERKVGEIRSAVSAGEGFVGLAMLTRMGLDESAGFTVEPANAPGQKASIWTS